MILCGGFICRTWGKSRALHSLLSGNDQLQRAYGEVMREIEEPTILGDSRRRQRPSVIASFLHWLPTMSVDVVPIVDVR